MHCIRVDWADGNGYIQNPRRDSFVLYVQITSQGIMQIVFVMISGIWLFHDDGIGVLMSDTMTAVRECNIGQKGINSM
jgi:hypothetical protein